MLESVLVNNSAIFLSTLFAVCHAFRLENILRLLTVFANNFCRHGEAAQCTKHPAGVVCRGSLPTQQLSAFECLCPLSPILLWVMAAALIDSSLCDTPCLQSLPVKCSFSPNNAVGFWLWNQSPAPGFQLDLQVVCFLQQHQDAGLWFRLSPRRKWHILTGFPLPTPPLASLV